MPCRASRFLSLALAGACAAGVTLAARAARANDRKFTYTYETAVLPPGGRELELWTTWRAGRNDYYSAFDHRLEFEVGLSERLMTAFYLNFRGVAAEDEAGERQSSFDYQGVSSEWKLKLSDPVADPLGFGLYAEGTLAPEEYELEFKLLLDKVFGNVLVAFNAVGELEWELESNEESEAEVILEPVAGVSYAVTPVFSTGVEVRNRTVIEEGEIEQSTLFGGPVVAVTQPGWWATLTFLPQLTDFELGKTNLITQEKVELRLLFSMHL